MNYFFRCDNALAAADFAAADDVGLLITLEARDATAALVTSSCVRYCVSVLAAADRCAAVEAGLLKTFDAIDATRLLVSLEDISSPLLDVPCEAHVRSRAPSPAAVYCLLPRPAIAAAKNN
jgi:hypothetical protein